MSPLAVGRELISSWDCREFDPAEWWRSNSLTPRIESLTTLLKANVNIDSSNNLARLVITSLQIITMTRNTLIELRQIKKAAVYRQWRDEDDEQRLDLPMALHPALSEALTLATRPDLASLRCRTTSHHSRRCSSPPRRGDSMRHGAACLVLLWRHCCKRDGKIKNKIEKELSKEKWLKKWLKSLFSMIWRYSVEWNVDGGREWEREFILPSVREDMVNKKTTNGTREKRVIVNEPLET